MTKIRGNTVGTPIKPKAAILKAELTEEEKAQFRTKIGAAAPGEGGGTGADLTNYYTKSEVDGLIPDVSGYTTMTDVEAKGYQTEAQVQTLIDTAIANIPDYNGEVEDV